MAQLQRFTITMISLFMLASCLGGGGDGGGDLANDNNLPQVGNVTLVVQENNQVADGVAAISITAVVRDSSNLPMANMPVEFRSSSATAIFEIAVGNTNEQGIVTTTVTNTIAEIIEVVARSNQVDSETVQLTFGDQAVDERVALVKVIVTDNFQLASSDLSNQVTLTVVARDQANVPLADIEVSLASTSTSAFIEDFKGKTDKNGSFFTKIVSDKAETFEVTAIAGGKRSEPAQITFIAPIEDILLSAQANTLPIGAQTAVTATFFQADTEGKPLPNAPFHTTISGAGVLIDVSTQADNNGQATFLVTNEQSETVSITITSGPITRTLPIHFGSKLQLLPAETNAIGKAALKALLMDGYHSPLGQQAVHFNFINAENETLSETTVSTAQDGTASIDVLDLGQDGGTVTVRASTGQLEQTATVKFLTDIGQGKTLSAETSTQVLKLSQSATITATIKDGVGVPVSGQPLQFAVNGSAQLSENNAATNDQGQAQITVSNRVGENVIVEVKAGTSVQTIPLYFGANINLMPEQIKGSATGSVATTLLAFVGDASGVGIPGIDVNFRTQGGSALLNPFKAKTNEIGQAEVNVTNVAIEKTFVEASAGSLSTDRSEINFELIDAGVPSKIILTTNPPEPIILSLNGTASIRANVLDARNMPVDDGTRVNFKTNGIGRVTESAFTRNGFVEVIFNAGTKAGLSEVIAFIGNEGSGTNTGVSIIVKPGDEAGIIEVDSIQPAVIGIEGSGVEQAATILFSVKDNLGNAVNDGTLVSFSLGNTVLGGGEAITTGDNLGKTAVGKTNNGLVPVTLKSGRVAGNVDVIATVGEISTLARVIVVGGMPDYDHLSLAAEFLNIAGGVKFGLQDEITAYVGDRFGNVVADGTTVSFITEGGLIGESVAAGAFTATTNLGQAKAILQSAEPTTPYLGGVPQFAQIGFQCSPNFLYVESTVTEALCGNPGLTTIVAYTTGSESFVDANGNGRFDNNEDFKDLSEPYIDANDNGDWDIDELYVDANKNGQFDQPNGQFDDNLTIWKAMRVLFSGETIAPAVTPETFAIPNGGTQVFTVNSIGDRYNNALVKDSKFRVSTNNGVLGGTTEFTFVDSNGRGAFGVQFTLSSNPPNVSEKGVTYPPTEFATITISIESPGVGKADRIISGSINN